MKNIEYLLEDDGKKLTLILPEKVDYTLHGELYISYKDKFDLVTKVVLDFKKVNRIDSSGMGMLLILKRFFGGDDADINIINTNPYIKKKIISINFQTLFNIISDGENG